MDEGTICHRTREQEDRVEIMRLTAALEAKDRQLAIVEDALTAQIKNSESLNLVIYDRDAALEAKGREVERPHIADSCPSCGGAHLFIGAGGWLTCSWLKCKEPGVTRAVRALDADRDALKGEIERQTELIANLDAAVSRIGEALGFVPGGTDSHGMANRAVTLRAEVARLTAALERIAAWEMPEVTVCSECWGNIERPNCRLGGDHSTSTPTHKVAYGSQYGSNGERDLVRSWARDALPLRREPGDW